MRNPLKNTALLALKVTVSAGLLYMVLNKVGAKSVLMAMRNAGAGSFIAAVALYLLMTLLTSIRWGLLLGRNIGRVKLFRLQMLGTFFNTFLPGLVGGDAVKIFYMYKMAGMGAEAVSSVFMDRYLGYAALILLGLMAYPFGYASFSGTWITWVLPAMVSAFAIGSALLFGVEAGGKRFDFLSRIYGYFRAYRSRRSVMAKAVGIGLIVHSTSAVMVYILSAGMGESIPLMTLLVFIPIVSTLAALPFSVGGIGIREAAMVMLLGTIGVGEGQAAAISFLWYFAMVAGSALGASEYIRSKDYIKEAFTSPGDAD